VGGTRNQQDHDEGAAQHKIAAMSDEPLFYFSVQNSGGDGNYICAVQAPDLAIAIRFINLNLSTGGFSKAEPIPAEEVPPVERAIWQPIHS
jgi:hypothetical protein